MTQAWDKALRARGYRVTPQRQLVLAAVTKLEHATPEEIWADVQQTATGSARSAGSAAAGSPVVANRPIPPSRSVAAEW